ncbi:MAG: hypothetical protein ACYCPF_07755 [Streptosporangiaceae bacterium]
MKAMEILAVKHVIPTAAVTGTVPLIGSSSLASFALGALVAGVCFAALTSPWWRGGAMLVPVRTDRSRPARPDRLTRPALSRQDRPVDRPGGHPGGLRGRIDALLAGLLSDDADDPDRVPDSSGHEFVDAATAAAAPGIRLSGDPAAPVADGQGPASGAAVDPDSPASAAPGPIPAQSGAPKPDESFWGPMSAAERDAEGYHSRHRLAGPGREPRRSGGVRNAPRHAAPPARLSVRRALGARRPVRRVEVSAVPGIHARGS